MRLRSAGDTEAKYLDVVDGVCCGLGSFGGLFIVVVSVCSVIVVVITGVVITRWRGLVGVVVGWVHGRIGLGGG